ncbi:acetyltransferase [Spirochaetia bacterium]|nr:acetyltransferase [Spirochaetia bacterium]
MHFLALFFVLFSKIFGFFHTSILISTIPLQIGNRIRFYFYKKTLKSLGNDVTFSYGTILSREDISIGNNVRFGPYCSIGLVDFGNDIIVAQSVHFLSGRNQHGIERNGIPMCRQSGGRGGVIRITIADDIWIGAQSVIMTNIPEGCVIGAGSIVVKDIQSPFGIYAGNPAKLIRIRT